MPDRSVEMVPVGRRDEPAPAFSADGVQQARRTIQGGQIQYLEFCSRIAAAGCAGYQMGISGKRALYYGRSLDQYVKWLPGAKP